MRSKYQLLINKREKAGVKHFQKTFIGYSPTVDDFMEI